MITRWRLFNFKSVRKDTTVDLAPLTLFAGANSSGKSTIIQSMLLIAQTLQSRVASKSVVLNGPLVRLGAFDDIKSFGSGAEQILVGWALENRKPGGSVTKATGEVSFDLGRAPVEEVAQLRPQLFSAALGGVVNTAISPIELMFSVVRSKSTAAERLSGLALTDALEDTAAALEFLPTATPADSWKLADLRQEEFLGCEMRHFLPSRLLSRIDKTRPAPFAPIDLVPLGNVANDLVDYTDRSLALGLRYMGPLRDEPKAVYPLATAVDPSDCGARGEFTAGLLDLRRNDRIDYMASSHFQLPMVSPVLQLRTLLPAVLDWLRYMGVVDNLEVHDLGKLGHELKVTLGDGDKPHDLTHVGVGVSQVLPIVVSCLLADRDTTLLFEQPELHLHPKVQTLLADFFLSIAMSGRQVIVETHSEYLINRLRYRAAAAQGDVLNPLLKMYFVEKDAEGTRFRDVAVNRYGAILDWPREFFDQSQREAERILKAGIEKKRREREAAQASKKEGENG